MPDWKRYLREHLPLPQMRDHREERAIQELADHLEDLYREACSRGASDEEAEALVLRWLGPTDQAASELLASEPARLRARLNRWAEEREEALRHQGNRWTPVADLARDLRTSVRALGKHPLFSGIVILVLALGIGASTAIFTLVDTIVLSPLPFQDANDLVAIQHAAPARGLQDAGQCAAWHFTYEDESRAFAHVGMFTGSSVSVTGGDRPENLPTLQVTSGVFRAIRVTPVLGRIFTAQDEDPEGNPTVMLSHGYWQSRYGGDPSVLGQIIVTDGLSREVIGVMPPEIEALGYDPALITPLRFRRSSLFVGNIGYDAVGRLNPGFDLQEAQADAERLLPLAWEKFPGGPVASSSDPSLYMPDLRPLKADLVGSAANLLWVLLGGVAVVLLIACANVANLFLVRAEGKDGEMAVRTALGASRRRIGWEYLKESLLLGLLGGAGGLALATFGLRVMVAGAPSNLPRLAEVSLNPTVLAFCLVISVGAGLFFGVFPVFRTREAGVVDSLKGGGRSGMSTRGRNRIQAGLAMSQIAFALVLLVASGLMFRSSRALRDVDPGFRNANEILAFRLYIPGQEIPTGAEVAAAYETMARRLGEIPGVASVGLATALPMHGGNNVNPFFAEGEEENPYTQGISYRHKWIGEGYLETMGTRLLMGRSFTWDDIHARAPLALLSESLARQVFGSPEAAMGRRVAARPDPPQWKEIIGIVADVREDGMGQSPPLMVYWPQVTLGFWEGNAPDQVQTWRGAAFAVRGNRIGTPGFLSEVEEAIWEVNPNLPLTRVGPLSDFMARSMARTSFTTILLAIAASVALIVGLVGVYGVISYAVSQRGRELGMRIALGAPANRVKIMVLRQGLVLSTVGIGVGLALALGLTRLLSTLLFGVSPVDGLTFAAVSLGLLAVGLLASWVPARRASRVDPMVALRTE
jgi:predicted permease